MLKRVRVLSIVLSLIAVLFLTACNNNSVNFIINFDSNGGSTVESINYDGVSTITMPDNPTKEGFVFDGWYWDNGTFEIPFTANSLLDTPIESDLTVYAKWILDSDPPVGTISVTFITNGGTDVPNQNTLPGSKLSIPQTQKEGHTLDGWYTSLNEGVTLDERWSFANNTVDTQLVLYAKWQINQYTITFDTDGGNSILPITQDFNTAITAPVDPIKTGYTFIGWNQDIPSQMPAEDITVTSLWQINQYTITFDTDGGNDISAITQDFNTTITAPNDPIKTGYTFIGWDKAIPTQMPAKNNIITALWEINQYNIVFRNHDNTILSTQQVNYGDIPIYDGTPVFESLDYIYIFNGWNKEIEVVSESQEYIAQYVLQLYTPQNVSINNGILSWDVIPNAISYKVIVEGNEYITFTNSYTFLEFNTVHIEVLANGTGNIIDSSSAFLTYVENGITYINYGKYPQTVVSDANLINALNTLTQTNSEGYYEYNGNEYAKVTATPYTSGYQFTTGTIIISDQIYYFKVEPIKWHVISHSDGTLQLLSKYIIDKQIYHPNTSDRTIEGETIYSNNYKHSQIRRWLNETFYNKAFGMLDQNAILTTLVDNSAATTGLTNNRYASENTNDKIYLLSYQDARNENYGFVSNTSSTTTREAQTTDYARTIGAYTDYNGNGYWWLRSPDQPNLFNLALIVGFYGSLTQSSSIYNTIIGVRPTLQIK